MLGNEVLNKEQLYDLFQQILGIKKFEHQLLYNAMQLENTDEQAAAIRRELDARQERLQEMQRVRLERRLHLFYIPCIYNTPTDWHVSSSEQEIDAEVRPEGDGVLVRGGDDAAD